MKVIVNSLPKSGTHLLTRIMDLLGMSPNKVHFSSSMIRFRTLNPLNYLKYIIRKGDRANGFWVDLDQKNYVNKKFLISLLTNFPANTYSQGHLPYSVSMIKFLTAYNIKVLYIIRDPRDILVSHFHHHMRDMNYQGFKLMNSCHDDKSRILTSLKGFNFGRKNENAALRTRLCHSIGWYTCKFDNVLSVKFEDLIGVKGGGDVERQKNVLKKIEKFLNLQQNNLVDKSNDIYSFKSSTFRKGIIGDYNNYFDSEIISLVKDEIGEYLIELGYEKNSNW